MHLKTLTVRGFKSFASATSFEFEPGVTAVVGPNGSGKSNVVDALAWVMGEQGAKSLRGGKMEDVIFAGTSGRAALGRAQVSLTIDNADGLLPIEYSEVTISRTLFRSGGSEYAINGAPCRLLDIQELLSDSGLGREMHVIVGQGQLDRILHATPEERRGFIEEAAGVLKHRRRKEKTLRKLASMEQNLARLEDLAGEIGKQLTPLGRQAKVARRAQKIQAELRDARARIAADDWVQASTAIETDVQELQRVQQQLQEAESAHARLTEQIAALEADAARLAPEASRTRDTYYALGQLKERFASLAQLAQERQRAVAVPVARAHLRDPQQLQETADRRAREVTEAEAALEGTQEAHRQATEARSTAEEQARTEEQHHAALLAAAATRRENIAALRGTLATAKSQQETLLQRRREQQQRIETVRERLAGHEQQLAQLEGASGPTEADHQRAAEASETTHRAQEETQAALDRAATQRSRTQRELDAARARLAALEDSLPAADATEAVAQRFAGRVRRLRESLAVDPPWAAALAAALGPVAEGLVPEDPALVPEILGTAQAQELGVVHLLLDHAPEDSAAPGDRGSAARTLAEQTTALDLRWAPQAVTGGDLARAVRAALQHTVLAQDSAAAALWWTRLPPEQRQDLAVACTDGTVLTASTARGGSADAVSGLEVAARVEQAQQALAALEDAHHQAEDTHQQARERHDAARRAAQEAREEFSRISRESTTNASQLARARTLVSSTQEELEQAQAQEEGLRAQEPAAEEALQQAVSALSAALELQDQGGTEALEAAAQSKDAAQEQARAARTAETEALLAVRAAQAEIEKLTQRHEAARRAVASERAAHAQADREEAQRQARYAAISRTLDMVGTVAEQLEDSLARAQTAREQAQTRRAAVETQLGTAREQEKQQRTALDALRSRAHSGELERATREARLEGLREQILEELSLTAEALVQDYGPHLMVPEYDENGDPWREVPFVREAQEKRLHRARKDLKALGKVNPLALEEFAALEERHTYLVQQLEDLKSSRDDLQQIIRDVDDHVRQVFGQAFEDTQREFLDVFQVLFPGGEGRLVLTEPGDLLNTGIEVHAKPAGKKVKRLSLLSGGERSLTAIAMLVAIFKARPSPFYVMDEVEAALDDRNLGRLLTILKQLQETSQLIIITHQKRTMEIADALYGVSMRGDGITQVISQRLADLKD